MLENLLLWREAMAAIALLHLCFFLCFQTRRVPMTSVRKFSREDREKAQERLWNTPRAHHAVRCVTRLLSARTPPHFLCPERFRGGAEPILALWLWLLVSLSIPVTFRSQCSRVDRQLSQVEGRVLLREPGILVRRKAAFHEVSAEDTE